MRFDLEEIALTATDDTIKYYLKFSRRPRTLVIELGNQRSRTIAA